MKRMIFTVFLLAAATPLAAGCADYVHYFSAASTRPRGCDLDEFRGSIPDAKKSDADSGDPVSQFQLGAYCEDGIKGYAKDNAAALTWYRKSADQGFIPAMLRLAAWYFDGDGPVKKDVPQAVVWYRKCAEAGHPDAQIRLGQIYTMGWGDAIPVDHDEAYQWFRKAAMHGKGEAIPALRYERIHRETRPKAEAGDPVAQYYLAMHLKNDTSRFWHYDSGEAPTVDEDGTTHFRVTPRLLTGDVPEPEYLPWLRKSADQGYPPAQVAIGKTGFAILHGAGFSDADIFKYLQQAADVGDTEGMLWLGLCYAQGKGVKRDDDQAFQLLLAAGEKGCPDAAELLAYAYAQGTGVKADSETALDYLRKSPNQPGDASLASDAGFHELKLAGIYTETQNHAEAVRWLKAAIKKGNAAARVKLAGYHLTDKHVPQDLAEAVRLLEASSDFQAKRLLAVCHYLGWGVPADEAEALRIIKQSLEYMPSMENIGLSADDMLRLYLCEHIFILCGEANDGDGLGKCAKTLDDIAARCKDTEDLRKILAGLQVFLYALRDQPGDAEKVLQVFRHQGNSEATDSQIYLEIVETFLRLNLIDHAQRWLDKPILRNTLPGKEIAADIKQRQKRRTESLLMHIRCDDDGRPCQNPFTPHEGEFLR